MRTKINSLFKYGSPIKPFIQENIFPCFEEHLAPEVNNWQVSVCVSYNVFCRKWQLFQYFPLQATAGSHKL